LRKFAAILLLVLFLFNWFGYQPLISFLEEKANMQLETQLDKNNFDESQLVSVKIPAHYFSGYVNAKNFERADGQVDINGIIYNYVKVRVYNDSLEMLCIPNNAAMKLSSAKDSFFKLVNDLQHRGNKKSNPGFYKNISTDYLAINDFTVTNNNFSIVSKWPPSFIGHIQFHISPVLENPPEAQI
jgi:hypothetical protein